MGEGKGGGGGQGTGVTWDLEVEANALPHDQRVGRGVEGWVWGSGGGGHMLVYATCFYSLAFFSNNRCIVFPLGAGFLGKHGGPCKHQC